MTATGSIYEVGDSRQPFTIQSIFKPFVYGLALEDHGRTAVLQKVGLEPTGDAFNSISLDPDTGRPRNPMINAGAIATSGLVQGKTAEGRFNRVLDVFGHYAGRSLEMDDAVYRSERETGHRNRAISHMLRNFDILEGDPAPALDLYFRQCSIAVTCRDLRLMAATLANRGVNPVTGRQAIRGEYVESVLSVMGSCGMYDYAGSWIYHVGIPAKSGVAGGIIAVLPGQLGIGVFSPKLDEKGNLMFVTTEVVVQNLMATGPSVRHVILDLRRVLSMNQSSTRMLYELLERLVTQGRASVVLPAPTGARRRLASFSAGMAFGEMGFVDRAPRSATVIADTELVCDSMDIESFEAVGRREPGIKIKLLENLCLELSSKLRKTNRELSIFE